MKELESFVLLLSELIIPLTVSIAAAIARIGKHGWRGLTVFLRELVLCCFYGIVMYWLLDLTELSPTVKYGVTGSGVYAFLELGNVIFTKLEKIIIDFNISDILPWIHKKTPPKDE